MSTFAERMVRAARLDVRLYEEVEADQTALGQAVGVVILSSLAGGIANWGVLGVGGLIGGAIGALIGWFIWALLTYAIGTKLLPEPGTQANLGQMLRTIGFSASPGLIQVIGILPFLSRIVQLVAAIWMLVAFIIAVRQALDYTSTLRAAVVCIIGWIIQVAIVVLLLMAAGYGPHGPAA
jgi:hypothetical protein